MAFYLFTLQHTYVIVLEDKRKFYLGLRAARHVNKEKSIAIFLDSLLS
jgi:hypothetical protein